jgi:SH3-like domain-containing protein
MRSIYFTYIFVFLLFLPTAVCAGEKDKMEAFHTSGLPLPRFVSVEDEKTHVRAGPGEKYPILWVIERKHLPLEVILEYENWRKIRDIDGQEGWVFQGLLSGKRTGIIQGKDKAPVYQKPYDKIDENAMLSLYLEPSVMIELEECEGVWCAISSSGFSGWLQRKYIWGVYESENFH